MDELRRLRTRLSDGLNSTHEMRAFAARCRSIVQSEIDGACALLLFAYYLESIANIRESDAIDADTYEAVMSPVFQGIDTCLRLIDQGDIVGLVANLDSFARCALNARIL